MTSEKYKGELQDSATPCNPGSILSFGLFENLCVLLFLYWFSLGSSVVRWTGISFKLHSYIICDLDRLQIFHELPKMNINLYDGHYIQYRNEHQVSGPQPFYHYSQCLTILLRPLFVHCLYPKYNNKCKSTMNLYATLLTVFRRSYRENKFFFN